MHVVGIDPAADTFVAGTYPATTAATFDNTAEGIADFLAALPDGALVAVENTGVYHPTEVGWARPSATRSMRPA